MGGTHAGDRRRAMAARVSLLGLVLLTVLVVHQLRHPQGLLATTVGIVVPAAFVGVLVAAGPWLYALDYPAKNIDRISRWVVVGTAVGALVGAGIVAHLSLLDYRIAEGPFIVSNIGIAGAVGGLLVGYFESQGMRKAAHLEQNIAKFQAVFEGTHDALVVADDTGTYVDANPAAAALFGVERSELIGMSIQDFAASDFDFDREWSDFRQDKRGRGQFPLVRPNGTKRIVEFAATSDIYPGHHLSALRDVTDRVMYEQGIEHQQETLSFLNQVLRHNVLNGVHVILARAELLSERVSDTDREHVDAIGDRGENIADLVSRVNRLNTTMQSGHQLEQVELDRLLGTVTQSARVSFPEAEVSLPEPLPDVVVDADTMLEEVFENLVTNAIRHNDTDTPEVTISVATDDESVTATVSDNGPGIPDDKKDIVFGRGEKGPASDGTGFGLYIVRTLVERYGGGVELSDNVPRGSTFEVTLPRVERVPAASEKRHP
ncbi:ATP-binding protein [Halomicroarcula sp. GCM10025710]